MNPFKPKLLGFYRLTSDHKYVEGFGGLKYLLRPEPGQELWLSQGYTPTSSQYDRSNDGRDKLGNLVNWIINNRDSNTDFDIKIGIICEMGLLTSLLNLPYESKEDNKQEFAMNKSNGIIFIKRINVEKSQYDSNMLSFAGEKFEEIVTEKLNINDECNDTFTVLNVNVSGMNILYSCQVDCTDRSIINEPKLENLIEIKTINRPHFKSKSHKKFREILSRKWWRHCLVSGVDQIFVGIRRDVYEGHRNIENIYLTETETMSASTLPRYASGWSVEESMKCLNDFFKKIRNISFDENVVFKISFIPKEDTYGKHKFVFTRLDSIERERYPLVSYSMMEKLEKKD